MKKSIFIGAAYMFFLLISMQLHTYAQAADSASDSHIFETAQECKAGQNVQGKIATSADAGYYRFTIDEKGVYRFGVTLTDENSSSVFYLSVYDSDKKLLEEIDFDIIDVADLSYDSYIYSEKYECDKGTTFYVAVTTEQEEDVTLHIDAGYQLCCKALKLKDQEQEPNNALSGANTIRNGVNIYGTISENEDIDYYCYIAEKSGRAIIVFDGDAGLRSFGWNIEVYDNSKKKLVSLLEKNNKTRKGIQVTKGQKYYIKVYGGETCFHSNESILNKEYVLNMKI